MREYHYTWQWDLKSSPEALWPLVSDTNRFNRDTHLPPMQLLGTSNGIKKVRFKVPIFRVEWDEEPFDWAYPYHFGVIRHYTHGPLKEMRVDCRLYPLEEGGTRLVYKVWVQGRNIIGHLAIPVVIGLVSAKWFGDAFKLYDNITTKGGVLGALEKKGQLSSAGRARLRSTNERLISQGADAGILNLLFDFLDMADDLSVQRLRPYILADRWGVPRRLVLETFLQATRAGALDMYWDLLCPECSGVTDDFKSLNDLNVTSHCPSCQISYKANFDHNVEVIFRPNSSIRKVDAALEFCVGNPQRQPKVAFNIVVPANSETSITAHLEEGRYNITNFDTVGTVTVMAEKSGPKNIDVVITETGWENDVVKLAPNPEIKLINKTGRPQTYEMMRASWGDHAATAADVTSLQVFRGLFSSEVIRSGEQISVGSVTILFTDLRSSTKLYREIGDAAAYSRVREHFEVLQRAIAVEGGAVIKTIGDSIMAVFRQPAPALRAVAKAHKNIKEPLMLKIGIHHGPCLAVNLNDRLDYFGSTINIAARLPNFSEEHQVIFSDAVYNDPGAQAFFAEKGSAEDAFTRFDGELKGFDEAFSLWKMNLSKIDKT